MSRNKKEQGYSNHLQQYANQQSDKGTKTETGTDQRNPRPLCNSILIWVIDKRNMARSTLTLISALRLPCFHALNVAGLSTHHQ